MTRKRFEEIRKGLISALLSGALSHLANEHVSAIGELFSYTEDALGYNEGFDRAARFIADRSKEMPGGGPIVDSLMEYIVKLEEQMRRVYGANIDVSEYLDKDDVDGLPEFEPAPMEIDENLGKRVDRLEKTVAKYQHLLHDLGAATGYHLGGDGETWLETDLGEDDGGN